MIKVTTLQLSLTELCQATELPRDILFEIIDEGILDPVGSSPENWQFSSHTVSVAKKAVRLHRDLDIDWPGIALAISLLEDLEQLRNENQQLKKRLQRFMSGNGS
jgi:chaperone modulatory protein CbpM